MAINIFIDTNVYLTFFDFSSDDLERLKQLNVLIEKGKIKLFITKQVKDEFIRNREIRISNALEIFEKIASSSGTPVLIKGCDAYHKLEESIKNIALAKFDIREQLKTDISKNALPTDNIISDLFDKATLIGADDEIYSRAERRVSLGNPPGKNGSLGDAVNWESLLSDAPNGEDIYLVSKDKDFSSLVNKLEIKEFLSKEWRAEKNSEITLLNNVTDFFKREFPEIKIDSDIVKHFAIEQFVYSGSFAITHSAAFKLSSYSDFTADEAKKLCEAAVTNRQIYWIKDDNDVREFLQRIFELGEEKLGKDNHSQLGRLLNTPSGEDFEPEFYWPEDFDPSELDDLES